MLKIAVMSLRTLGREGEAAALLGKHLPSIEASDFIRPVAKVDFLLEATQWMYTDHLLRAFLTNHAAMVVMAKRVLTLARQLFEQGTGRGGRPKAEDTGFYLYRSYSAVAGSLNLTGDWQESLFYSQKALELSRLAILSALRGSDMDLLYFNECQSVHILAEILRHIGRVGEVEALLRSALQTQLDRTTSLSAFSDAKGLLMLRGELAELLTRCLGRHEEALEQLQQLRREVLPCLTIHSGDTQEIDEIKMRYIGRHWPTAADCLLKLGREDEAYQWDEEAVKHASNFLVGIGNVYDIFPDFPCLRAARLSLRNWEKKQEKEGDKNMQMSHESRLQLFKAVELEAARVLGQARGRDKMPFYMFVSDGDHAAQELMVSFAKHLLSKYAVEDTNYMEKVCRIA